MAVIWLFGEKTSKYWNFEKWQMPWCLESTPDSELTSLTRVNKSPCMYACDGMKDIIRRWCTGSYWHLNDNRIHTYMNILYPSVFKKPDKGTNDRRKNALSLKWNELMSNNNNNNNESKLYIRWNLKWFFHLECGQQYIAEQMSRAHTGRHEKKIAVKVGWQNTSTTIEPNRTKKMGTKQKLWNCN